MCRNSAKMDRVRRDPLLSIVIPSFQRSDAVRRLVESLADDVSAHSEDVEVIVVLDGSTDDSAAQLEPLKEHLPLSVLWQENTGLAGARNAGLSAAKGRSIWFLDDDMIVGRGVLAVHLQHHAEDHASALAGPCWIPNDADSLKSVIWWHNNLYEQLSKAGKITDPMVCHFANTSLSTADLLELGGFRADIREYGCEDNELAFRWFDSGKRVDFSASAAVEHQRERKAVSDVDHRRSAGRNQVKLAEIHPAHLNDIFPGYEPDPILHLAARAKLHKLLGIDRWLGLAVTASRATLRAQQWLPNSVVERVASAGSRAAEALGVLESGGTELMRDRVLGFVP